MHYGWFIVGSGCFISLYISGVIVFGFTAAFEPLVAEFGWSYAQISLAASLRGLEMGFLIPLAGLLLDRFGPRLVVAAGVLIAGLGMILLSRVDTLWMFYGCFCLLAAGTSVGTSFMMMAVVSGWFKRRAGLAMGLAATGTALGGLLVPAVALLIDTLGWRQAMLWLGVGALMIPAPLALFFKKAPRDDSADREATAGRGGRPSSAITVGFILRDRPFWIITLAFTWHITVVVAVITHVMPFLGSIGLPRSSAAILAGVLPMISIVGRIGLGWLGDGADRRRLAATAFVLTAVGVLGLAWAEAGRWWLLALFCLAHGLGWGGAVPTMPGLLRERFGNARIGTVLGLAAGIMTAGTMVGAPLAGWVFDTQGTYRPVWIGFALLSALAAGLVLLLGPAERD